MPTDGSSGGWVLDPNLRCDRVTIKTGPRAGSARLTYVAEPPEVEPFEKILKRYTSDDQVRIEVFPIDDEMTDSPGDARVLFEGVLTRHQIDVQADGGSAKEVVRFVALPFPWLDDTTSCHLVRGRWVAPVDLSEEGEAPGSAPGTFFTVESPDLPPVFNFRGVPNRHPTATICAAGGTSLTAPVFTHDHEPDGQFWTVREALASILVMCLYGVADSEAGVLPRHVDLESVTAAALNTDAGGERPDDFLGLDAFLPETNIYGMGVFEAFGAVCRAGGFEFALEPPAFTSGSSDRSYQLRLWRRGTGRVRSLDLDKSASTYSNAEAAINRNNLSKLNAVRDGAEIVNEVYGVGRVLVEAAFELRPLWHPDDVDSDPVSPEHQVANESNLNGSGYHAKHVANGLLFGQYGFIGRSWGQDCIGGFDGYPEDPYQQTPEGFDFVAALDLNGTEATHLRSTLGIKDPIRWTRRVRPPLPLRNPEAKRRGVQYCLEVSEDAGVTYNLCSVRFQTLTDTFGIFLQVPNLATINNASIGTGALPDVSESWWQLMLDQQLLFVLTCTIEADHALRFDATHRSTSGSRYKRGQVSVLPYEQVWWHPTSLFNPDPELTTFGADDGTVRDAAERRRDAAEDVRLAAVPATWLMDLDRYGLGDRILGVRGRDYSFAANSVEGKRYPNVVGITYQLGPNSQSIQLSLHDHRLVGGVA